MSDTSSVPVLRSPAASAFAVPRTPPVASGLSVRETNTVAVQSDSTTAVTQMLA